EGGASTVGDGGQGIDCDGKHLLEFYEARNAYGFEPSFGAKFYQDILNNVKTAIHIARKRFQGAYGPNVQVEEGFRLALHIASHIKANMAWISHRKLKLINDVGPLDVRLPKGCSIFQAAYFQSRTQLKPRIVFYESVFSEFPNNDISALILHEAFHVIFSKENHNKALRQFIIFLSAPREFREKNKELFKILYDKKTFLPNGFYR
ncbi:MAG: hypothetical protein AABZ31_13455, partial [Bdellovibrionota bacterium]